MDFQILNYTTFIITPDVSQVCLQFVAFDDDSAEDPEQVIVAITMEDVVIGYTTVVITDNDGIYNNDDNYVYMYELLFFHCYLQVW